MSMSLPSRERGLKSDVMTRTPYTDVAPFTGAWIEIIQQALSLLV